MFDTFKSRYKLLGTINLESGLHIGGGEISNLSGSDNNVIKDIEGYPFIPGSSFKGVLRTTVEQIIRSFNRNGLWCCNIFGEGTDVSEKPCLDDKEKQKLIEKKESQAAGWYEQQIWSKSCDACRLFGSSWLASKIYVKDIYVNRATFDPILIDVRDGVAIDRDTETAKDQGKYDFEVVPAGTEFNLEIVLENPEDYEIGLLNLGFQQFNEGFAMLGGITSRGLGRIKIRWSEIHKSTPENLLNEKKFEEITPDNFSQMGTETLKVKLGISQEKNHA